MNWSRGFFRAWIVFAVLWMIGTGASFLGNWPQRSQTEPRPTPVAPGQRPNIFDDLPSTVDIDAALAHATNVHLLEHLGLAIAPVAVFAFGWIVRWVLRGFKTA